MKKCPLKICSCYYVCTADTRSVCDSEVSYYFETEPMITIIITITITITIMFKSEPVDVFYRFWAINFVMPWYISSISGSAASIVRLA